MGTHFKKSIFDEHVQVGLLGWRQKVKEKKELKAALGGGSTARGGSSGGSSIGIQMAGIGRREATSPPPPPSDIQPANGS